MEQKEVCQLNGITISVIPLQNDEGGPYSDLDPVMGFNTAKDDVLLERISDPFGRCESVHQPFEKP